MVKKHLKKVDNRNNTTEYVYKNKGITKKILRDKLSKDYNWNCTDSFFAKMKKQSLMDLLTDFKNDVQASGKNLEQQQKNNKTQTKKSELKENKTLEVESDLEVDLPEELVLAEYFNRKFGVSLPVNNIEIPFMKDLENVTIPFF